MTGTGEDVLGQADAQGDGSPQASAVGLRVPGRDEAIPPGPIHGRGSICFDFDGTIVQYHGFKEGHIGPTIPGAINALKAACGSGFRVVIFTARTDGTPEAWVAKHGLDSVVDEVTNVKPKDCVRFFDDRATFVPSNSPHALEFALTTYLRRQEDGLNACAASRNPLTQSLRENGGAA